MIGALARRVLASPPLYSMARRRADERGDVLLLTYHTIGPDHEDFDAWTVVRRSDFLRQVETLRRHFDIVSIDDALVPAPGARARVVLTFDDGHTGWHDHLLPIAQREALPVTLYTATSHIERGELYWFDRVMNAAQVERQVMVDLQVFGLGVRRFGESIGSSNWTTISALLEAMKALDEDLRERATRVIERELTRHPKRPVTLLQPLTIEQLREIAASPLVTLGAHSDDHRLLDRIPLDDARASLARCREKLVAWTGRDVRHVAFPNGNFDAALCKLVADMGFVSAATTKPGRHRSGSGDGRALPRVFVGRYDDLDRFKLALVGN